MNSKRGVQRINPDESNEAGVEELMSNDDELSLEELSAAYSKLIGEPPGFDVDDVPNAHASLDNGSELETASADDVLSRDSGDTCIVSGRSILEAVLFVGNPDNIGLKPDSVSGMMRGVQASDIVEWIAELNLQYVEQDHAMRIVEDEQGYRMVLAPELQSIRDSMYGKLRETQLNQAAIDCLSLVAYRPGIAREEVERLWSRPASSILGLLVRRDLLRIEREGKGRQSVIRYFPTDRFLNLIGIPSLDDLPIAESEFE